MTKRLLALLVLIVVLAAGHPTLAAIPVGEGKLEGVLINKTQGSSSSVADQIVVLNVYQGSSIIDTKNTRSDSSGKFSFSGFAPDPAYIFMLSVKYLGADYFSTPIKYTAGETLKTVNLEVNDVSTTDNGIVIMLAHAVISKTESGINVSQYYFLANTTDRTFVGKSSSIGEGKNETIRLTLPDRVTGLQIAYGLTESELTKTGNDLVDSAPVTPAGREISFTYRLPSNIEQLSWKFNYHVSRFDILTSDPTLRLSGELLNKEDPLTISGKNYQDYSAQGLAAGETVRAQLSTGGAEGASRFSWAWLIIIPVVLIAAVVGIILVRKRKKADKDFGEMQIADEDGEEILLDELAALDDDFAANKIEEKEYQRLRAEKKNRLINLKQSKAEAKNKKE